MEKRKKATMSELASFIALLTATILFVIEYFVGAAGNSWSQYLLIAKDVAIAIGIIFGSIGFMKNRGLLIKIVFVLIVLVYIVFAFLGNMVA